MRMLMLRRTAGRANLDSLHPSVARVRSQVESGGGVMPSFKDKLTAAQINAVASFVASSAGH